MTAQPHTTGPTPTGITQPGTPTAPTAATELGVDLAARVTYEPLAVLATTNPALAAAVTALDPRVQIVNPDLGDPATGRARHLGARSGLLLLIPAGSGDPVTAMLQARKLPLTDDLDDATVWAQAVDWRAGHVVVLPDGTTWLTATLHHHFTHPNQR